MKFSKPVFFLAVYITTIQAATAQTEPDVKDGLKIIENKHYLTDAKTDKPVFILATTA